MVTTNRQSGDKKTSKNSTVCHPQVLLFKKILNSSLQTLSKPQNITEDCLIWRCDPDNLQHLFHTMP